MKFETTTLPVGRSSGAGGPLAPQWADSGQAGSPRCRLLLGMGLRLRGSVAPWRLTVPALRTLGHTAQSLPKRNPT